MDANLEPHPFNLVLRDMTEEEYTGLTEDIAEHGLRRPIVLYEGKILDGRHRYRACLDLAEISLAGRGPAKAPQLCFEDFQGDKQMAMAYVWSENLHRRHLTQTEKACLAVEWVSSQGGFPGRGGPRRGQVPKKDNPSLKEMAGALFGVHPMTIDDVAQVKRERPELFEVMRQGGIGLRAAQAEMRPRAKAATQTGKQITCPKCGARFRLGEAKE